MFCRIIAIIGILFFDSCSSNSKKKIQYESELVDSIVSTQVQENLIGDLDSVFFFYEKAKELPEDTRAVKVLETLDKSKLGSVDFYATNINDVFVEKKVGEISPVLIYYVEFLFLSCEENHKRYFDEEFDRMPESAQRASVQSEMNSRNNKLKKAKNILEAVLSVETENKAQAYLLYGNALYNLYKEEAADTAYAEYYRIMKEKGKLNEVPSYVTNPNERKMIWEE